MCLNPKKYTFKVSRGNFLGFMITHRGIETNLDKCTTILEMHKLTNVREVQKLNGRLTFMSRFLLKLAEKARPFYKSLRKTRPFLWGEAYKQAFLAFKKMIASLLVLSQPKLRVPLFLHLSVFDEAISSALVREEGKHQIPI